MLNLKNNSELECYPIKKKCKVFVKFYIFINYHKLLERHMRKGYRRGIGVG